MHRKTPEQIEWLKVNASQHTHAKTIQLFEERFGVKLSSASLATWMSKNEIKRDPETLKHRPWGEEEKAYLASVVEGRSHKAIRDLMSEKLGRDYSLEQIKGAIKRYGLNTGRTGYFPKGNVPANKGKTWDEMGVPLESQQKSRETTFKKGSVPSNLRPVGSERVDSKDGYIYVKVANKRNPNGFNDHRDLWKLKHRVIYEAHHGPVPEGHVVIFCDGNILNFDINNLLCISQEIHALMKLKQIKYYDRESAEAAITTAKLMIATKKAACRPRPCRHCGEVFKARYEHQKTCDICLGRIKEMR